MQYCSRELLENGLTHQSEFVRGVCSPNALQRLSRGCHYTCNGKNITAPSALGVERSQEDELTKLVHNLDNVASKFGMEISAEETKIMTNNGTLQRDITIRGQKLETVKYHFKYLGVKYHFKYIGAIVCDEGSTRTRVGQTMASLARLKTIWKDKNIRIKHKIRLMRGLVMTIFL